MSSVSHEDSPSSASNAPVAIQASWWRRLFQESEEAQLICRVDGTVTEFNHCAAEWLNLRGPQPNVTGALQPALTPITLTRLFGFLSQEAAAPATISSVTLLGGAQLGMIADLQITPLGGGSALLTIKDATRRWRMESQMQRLLAAVDATPDVVLLTDAESKLIYVNPAFQAVTGYTSQQALGRTPDFLRAPAEQKHIQSYMDHISGGLNWQGKLTNVRPNGSAYTVSVTISPICDQSGARLGFVSFERDISPIRSLEEELRAEHDYAASLSNSLDSVSYTTDRALRLSQINDGWRKMPAEHGWLTLDGAPRAGQPLLELVRDPARREEIRTLCQQVLDEGRLHELIADSSDGRQWRVRIAPWWQDGERRGVRYVVTDQTEFHQLQPQLNQAQKHEAGGTLADGVAPGFNNLNQLIRSYAGMALADAPRAPTLHPPSPQIDEATSRAAEIAQQFLAYVRDARSADVTLEFNAALAAAVKLFEPQRRANIQLKLEPAPTLSVRLDAARAQEILSHLFLNAQESMPTGGTISISLQTVQLSGSQAARAGKQSGANFVRCRVADGGTGIAMESLPHICDPFFTTKAAGKHLGLGLAAVHSLAALAAGFAEVNRVPGRGCTFELFFPLVAVETAPAAAAGAGAEAAPASQGRLLVVDDVDVLLEITSALLRDAGYEVFTATEAEDAMKVLDQLPAPVDLIFTDYNLGGKTGVDLMDEACARWPRTLCIISSGFFEYRDRQRIEQRGARVLEKPFKSEAAVTLIREMIEARAGKSAS